MSEGALARFKIVSIAVFVFGLVSAGLAFSLRQNNSPKMMPTKGFTLRSRDVVTLSVPREPGPKEIAYSEAVRYRSRTVRFEKCEGTLMSKVRFSKRAF